MNPYYEHRGIASYHGDSCEVLRELPSASMDMVLTDPPYLVSHRRRMDDEWHTIAGDSDPAWLAPVFVELWRVLKSDSLCLSFYGWPHADLFFGPWRLIGFRPVSHLVCVKNYPGLGYFTRGQHEPAYLLAKGAPQKPANAVSDVFEWERDPSPVHPSQKPIGVIAKLILAYTCLGARLLDPFMGSGATLVAARNLDRQAIGIEVEERYCEAAARRLAQERFLFEAPTTTQVTLALPETVLEVD